MVGADPSAVTPTHSRLLAVVLPLGLIVVILTADAIESPKTAYVGVLSAIPMLAAVFGTARSTAFVAAVTWLAAFGFGTLASDGNVTAQKVRLVIIALFGLFAVVAAAVRTTRDQHALDALSRAAQADMLAELAETDELTGLLNRRGVLDRLATAGRPCSIALVDLDGLKTVNDVHGHLTGDEVIRGVAHRLSGSVQRRDTVGRWGGDEFLVALPLGSHQAHAVMERVLRRVTADDLATRSGNLPVGLSIGLATREEGEDDDAVIARADRAMYEAKQAGRNRIELAAPRDHDS